MMYHLNDVLGQIIFMLGCMNAHKLAIAGKVCLMSTLLSLPFYKIIENYSVVVPALVRFTVCKLAGLVLGNELLSCIPYCTLTFKINNCSKVASLEVQLLKKNSDINSSLPGQ